MNISSLEAMTIIATLLLTALPIILAIVIMKNYSRKRKEKIKNLELRITNLEKTD